LTTAAACVPKLKDQHQLRLHVVVMSADAVAVKLLVMSNCHSVFFLP